MVDFNAFMDGMVKDAAKEAVNERITARLIRQEGMVKEHGERLTIKEAAKALNHSVGHVRELCAKGEIIGGAAGVNVRSMADYLERLSEGHKPKRNRKPADTTCRFRVTP